MAETAETKVSGVIVEVIRFRASADGAGVVKIRDAQLGHIRTVVGMVEGLAPGDTIEASGSEREHPHHGLQLKASRIHTLLPQTKKSARMWLTSHFSVTAMEAEALLDAWSSDFATSWVAAGGLADPADHEMEGLWEALSWNRAHAYAIFLKQNKTSLYLELVQYVQRKMTMDDLVKEGLTSKEALVLFRHRGVRAITELLEDPYLVYYYIEETNFEKLDKIYLRQPNNYRNDERRVKALCLNRVREFVENGDTAVLYDDLIDLMEDKHEYLLAREVLLCLHSLVPNTLEFYCAEDFGIRVQPVKLAQFEAGLAQWVKTGVHPEREKQDDGGLTDDDFD